MDMKAFSNLLLEVFFVMTGLLMALTMIYTLKDENHKTRMGTATFWGILAVIFIFGKIIPSMVVGILIVVIGILSALKQVNIGNLKQLDENFARVKAVKKLPATISGAEIIKLEIPTVFRESLKKIEENIEKHKPDIVICIGQAGGRYGITPERVGINIDDARIEDNKGNQPIDLPIFEDGENAYFSTLPIKAMVKELQEAGIPSSVSNTAGTFVCNHVMYGLMYMIDKKFPNVRGGFIHIPYMTSQVAKKPNTPSMSLDEIAKGLEICLKAAIENKEDVKTIGGTIC